MPSQMTPQPLRPCSSVWTVSRNLPTPSHPPTPPRAAAEALVGNPNMPVVSLKFLSGCTWLQNEVQVLELSPGPQRHSPPASHLPLCRTATSKAAPAYSAPVIWDCMRCPESPGPAVAPRPVPLPAGVPSRSLTRPALTARITWAASAVLVRVPRSARRSPSPCWSLCLALGAGLADPLRAGVFRVRIRPPCFLS